MRNRINTLIDTVVLAVGLFLTCWFYHELYLTFRIPGLAH